MSPRRRPIDLGAARGRSATTNVGRELETAIRAHGLTLAAIARDVGISDAHVGRVVRGQVPNLSIVQAAQLLAAVGLELSVRAYPTGRPLRDVAHLALLHRLRTRLHASLGWRSEVPLERTNDLRAWDAVITGDAWSLAVEAETRLVDLQALERRIALKQRDGGISAVLLLVADTRNNRAILRSSESVLMPRFPIPGRRAIELLAAGVDPGGGSIVRL